MSAITPFGRSAVREVEPHQDGGRAGVAAACLGDLDHPAIPGLHSADLRMVFGRICLALEVTRPWGCDRRLKERRAGEAPPSGCR